MTNNRKQSRLRQSSLEGQIDASSACSNNKSSFQKLSSSDQVSKGDDTMFLKKSSLGYKFPQISYAENKRGSDISNEETFHIGVAAYTIPRLFSYDEDVVGSPKQTYNNYKTMNVYK